MLCLSSESSRRDGSDEGSHHMVSMRRHIGVGRFRILGGQGLEYWGGPRGGPNSQQAHDVVTTSMRRNDVASTSFRRRVPTRFLINQCQIITFLILKYDIIENSRRELRGIVLPVQVDGLLGGPKGMLAPPSQIIGGAWPPLAPPPSSYAYETEKTSLSYDQILPLIYSSEVQCI